MSQAIEDHRWNGQMQLANKLAQGVSDYQTIVVPQENTSPAKKPHQASIRASEMENKKQ